MSRLACKMVGGQYNISHTDNIYVGSSHADTELKYSNLYLFTQLQGQQKWFSYQVGVGATRSSIHQGENGYSKWLFRPQVTLQAKASDRLSFKWSSKITSDIPSLSDLSELRQYIRYYKEIIKTCQYGSPCFIYLAPKCKRLHNKYTTFWFKTSGKDCKKH